MWKSCAVLLEFDDADELIKVDEKVTLMNWGNMMVHSKEIQDDGSYLIKGEYLPEDTDFKKTKKITWLAKDSNLMVADLIEYDHLIKVPKIEDDVDIA